MPKTRPSPEKLLKQAQEEEQQAKRGKLKIYLGAAPGVGKTYAMLQDALAQRAKELDVVVGIVESHGRREIETLLQNLEILPRQTVEYHGKSFLEFDLDAALSRNPGLILIDEVAHTNIPGLRHTKRWRDIKEVLDRGIDVYTTLNVQHIESLNDVIAQILHVRIQETIPDSMLDLADTIELVDLPPEDLIKRLQEGKVYFPDQIAMAKEHFFQKSNLTALRELALRITAERVGAQVLLSRQGRGIKNIWPTQEKLLVCVGSGPQSAKVIRTGRRLAAGLQAPWIAIHVDIPGMHNSEEKRNNSIRNLRLAEKLGAETHILTGDSIANEILRFAHEKNITTIMLWKRVQSQWKNLIIGSLADEITRHSGEIDVYIVTDDIETTVPSSLSLLKQPTTWKYYILFVGIIAFATLINVLLYSYLQISDIIMIYLLSIATIIFFSLSLITHRQIRAARIAESYTSALHALNQQLASTRGEDKLLSIVVRHLSEVFHSAVWALLPENDHLVVRSKYNAEEGLSPKEQGVAQWVYDLGQMAGLGTDTLPFSDSIYAPMLASQGPIGVLRLRPLNSQYLLTPEQMLLLESSANQVALALEVDRLQQQAQKSEVQTATESARSALLRSVSHDLRTPVIAIMGAATTLMEMGEKLDASALKKLGKDVYFESDQLNRLINNLLQMTYLEAEAVKLQKDFYSLQEIITEVIHTTSKKIGKKPIHVKLPKELPKIPFDNTLIQDVLINLIDNAIKFTPPKTPIEISAVIDKEVVVVCVADKGPGIVPDEINKLFEKFYRGRMLTTERGLGLGLAICRSIVHAHGGKMWAENRAEGGAQFCFTLPMYTT